MTENAAFWKQIVYCSDRILGPEYSEDGQRISKCKTPTDIAKWYYANDIQTYLALVDYSLLPFIAMLTMNIAIFLRLRKRDKQYVNCTTVKKDGRNTKSSHGKLSMPWWIIV